MFKFNLTNPKPDSDGYVRIKKADLEECVNQVADKVHEVGVGRGFAYGCIFTAGVYLVTDIICAIANRNNDDTPKLS